MQSTHLTSSFMQVPKKSPILNVYFLKQVFVLMLALGSRSQDSMQKLEGFNNPSLPTFVEMEMKKQNNFAHTLPLRSKFSDGTLPAWIQNTNKLNSSNYRHVSLRTTSTSLHSRKSEAKLWGFMGFSRFPFPSTKVRPLEQLFSFWKGSAGPKTSDSCDELALSLESKEWLLLSKPSQEPFS